MKLSSCTARALVVVGALIAGSMLFTGCATITRGTTEQLTIVSEPTGATVRLSNGFTGVTPATFTIPRKGDFIVTVSKEGYQSVDIPVSAKLAGAGTAGFVGNALIGGIIGGGVDIATGATLSHTPNPVHATLVALATVPTPPAPAAAPAQPPAPAPVAPAAPAPTDEKPATAPANAAAAPAETVVKSATVAPETTAPTPAPTPAAAPAAGTDKHPATEKSS